MEKGGYEPPMPHWLQHNYIQSTIILLYVKKPMYLAEADDLKQKDISFSNNWKQGHWLTQFFTGMHETWNWKNNGIQQNKV